MFACRLFLGSVFTSNITHMTVSQALHIVTLEAARRKNVRNPLVV
jgi:hypothetical protein